MGRFNKRGMLIIPNPMEEKINPAQKVIVHKGLYCPKGHNLVSSRAIFNGYPGIMIKVEQENKSGLVAVSPIYGDKSRISIDIDLISGQVLKIFCPTCNIELPTYSTCNCGADLITFFLTPDADYSNCIGICNRVDCVQSQIIESGELVSLSRIDKL